MKEANGIRILVVDDDEAVRASSARYLSLHLNLAKESVLTACSGRDAVRLLLGEEKAGRKVDAVLSDFSMPEWDGVQLYDQIEARWPDLAKRFAIQTGDPKNGRVLDLAARRVPVFEKDKMIGQIAFLRAVLSEDRVGP